VRYGTTGQRGPGYELKIVDDEGRPLPRGEIGDLWVGGPTSAAFYWNNRERSRTTFMGPWTRTGDKYVEDADGYFTYCGRSDDMLKVGGIYVSPAEVEAALVAHDSVLEAAVIGVPDESDLVKPKAFVKDKLAPYKYPRYIEFLPELPKTATGKIQRFRLREREQGRA
jgi:benzoate-CoA ligase